MLEMWKFTQSKDWVLVICNANLPPCSTWINSDIEKLSQPFPAKAVVRIWIWQWIVAMFISRQLIADMMEKYIKAQRALWKKYVLQTPHIKPSPFRENPVKSKICPKIFDSIWNTAITTFFSVDGLMRLLTAVWTNWTRVKNSEFPPHQYHHHHHHYHRHHHQQQQHHHHHHFMCLSSSFSWTKPTSSFSIFSTFSSTTAVVTSCYSIESAQRKVVNYEHN